MNREQEELNKKRSQEIALQIRREIDNAKEHIKKFTIKTDVAKKLREEFKASCDEYQPLEEETHELWDEKRDLEHKLKLLKAKIDANEAKLKLIRLIARDQKEAWMNEVHAQTREPLHNVHSGGHAALRELFGDCFWEEDLKMPKVRAGDYDA